MSLKTRLTKLEATIDPNVCPVCGLTLPPIAETRAQMESLLDRHQKEERLTRTEAIARMCEHAPLLMRRAGLMPIIPEGHCAGCGKSLKPEGEIARELLVRYT